MDGSTRAPERMDGEAFGRQLTAEVKLYFEQATAPLLARIDNLERQLAAANAREPVGIRSCIQDAGGCLILTLSNGNVENVGRVKGDDGETLAIETVQEMIHAEVAKIDKPKDGQSPSVGDVASELEARVAAQVNEAITALAIETIERHVAAIKPPKDGKDADPEEVKRLVTDLVVEAVTSATQPIDSLVRETVASEIAKLPTAEDGKSVTLDEVRPVLAELVAAEFSKLPAPRDGKDADLESVKIIVDACVTKAIASLPVPKDGEDGKSVTLQDLEPMFEQLRTAVNTSVKGAIDALPEATVDEVRRLRQELMCAVEDKIAALPKPKDGESVTVDDLLADPRIVDRLEQIRLSLPSDGDIAKLVGEALQKEVAALPPPRDGKDVDMDAVKEMVSTAVHASTTAAMERAIAALPTPAVKPEVVEAAVAAAIEKLPKPKDGEDGKSVSAADVVVELRPVLEELVVARTSALVELPALVTARVDEALAAIPAPKDGTSVTLDDVEPLIREIHDQIKSSAQNYIDAMINMTVAKLELPKGEKGDKGDGVTVDDVAPIILDAVRARVVEVVTEQIQALPPPKDGEDGKSVTAEDVAPIIKVEVERAVAALPPAKDGRDYDPDVLEAVVKREVLLLPKPKDGEPGKSVTVDDVRPLVEETVSRAVAALPVPLSVKSLLVDREGHLVATLSDGSVEKMGHVAGRDADMEALRRHIEAEFAKMPKPKDGVDGLSFADFDFDVHYDGEREVRLTWMNGAKRFERKLILPVPLYREIWEDGKAYSRGDAATYGGNIWIAKQDTTERPKEGDDSHWRLAVKKGRDGKDLLPKKPQGPVPLA